MKAYMIFNRKNNNALVGEKRFEILKAFREVF